MPLPHTSDDHQAVVTFLGDQLRQLVPELVTAQLEASSSILDTGVDSLALLQLVAAAEDRYDAMLPDEELVEVNTLGELADLVLRSSTGPADAPLP